MKIYDFSSFDSKGSNKVQFSASWYFLGRKRSEGTGKERTG